MPVPTPVLTTPSGAESLPFSPAGTWAGTGKLDRLLFQVRKASASDWDNPVINRTRYRSGITGNQNWSISLPASDRAKLKLGVSYQARVKVWSHAGVASSFSSATSFTITLDDPTITLNALNEESDGHTPLEGLVFTGTLTTDADVTPASIKLEIFESQSGDLKFSQMHAVTTEEAETGEWSIPYIGPDLPLRVLAGYDVSPRLAYTGNTTSSVQWDVGENPKAIIVLAADGGNNDLEFFSSVSIDGQAVAYQSKQSVSGHDVYLWELLDPDPMSGEVTLQIVTTGFHTGDIFAYALYANGVVTRAELDGTAGATVSPQRTVTSGANIGFTVIAAATNIGAITPLANTTEDYDVGTHKFAHETTPTDGSRTVGWTGTGVTAVLAACYTAVGLQDDAAYDGLYDIVVTIYDSAGGEASFTGDDYMRIYRALLDDESTADLTTGLSNIRPTQRILVRDMKANRGPGKVIGIIEDARNIGVSRYATSPGELYFTLQSLHPQISIIEPFATHYEYQQYRRGRWVSLEYGIFVDFDATEDEVVFYGMDYLGLLSVSIEGAHQIAKSPNKSISVKHDVLSGSRYKKKAIRYIIKNQLQRARKQETHSPVKFINIGTLDAMSTKVTIFASHVERLAFIRGLIESHKGGQVNGQERRTRLRVRYRAAKKDFAFELLDNKGSDKDALRLEFGSLVQGYRIIAYDDYRNKVYGIGVKPNASKPFFLTRVAEGVTLADWGVWGKAEMHGDIVDRKDLARRARASANRMSRPGKSIALGIRVRSIDYCDGYDVLDSVPVDIVDNAIDTNNFGGGYWTIWGINYRVYDDEHDELTWILRPKGDSDDFDPDLITSEPEAISSEWAWGSGEPTP